MTGLASLSHRLTCHESVGAVVLSQSTKGDSVDIQGEVYSSPCMHVSEVQLASQVHW